MKAKYFKKLRKRVQWYYVQETTSLFGSFSILFPSKQVLGTSKENALQRYFRRNHIWRSIEVTTEKWAKYKVTPVSKPFPRLSEYYF